MQQGRIPIPTSWKTGPPTKEGNYLIQWNSQEYEYCRVSLQAYVDESKEAELWIDMEDNYEPLNKPDGEARAIRCHYGPIPLAPDRL